MHRYLKTLAALSPAIVQPGRAGESNPVTAIDILLEPDATMIKHAAATNKRLLETFSQGFALDQTHQPHITCLQRYVKTAELGNIYEGVGKVLAEEKPTAWNLRGAQVLLHSLEGARPCRDRGRADRRPHQVPEEANRRRRPVRCHDGDRSGVRHHEG
jgi:hypothetical protein